jgi:hypothetical protein
MDDKINLAEKFALPDGPYKPEALVRLIEPRGTVNTGDAGGELTVEPVEL